jgi:hypothetical protein
MQILRVMLLAGVVAALCGTGCAPNPEKLVRTYRMGDRIEIGKLIYNVYDSQWHTQLGEGPTARVPQHRFFLVRFSVTNSGGSEIIPPSFTVTDSGGKTYQELSDGNQVPQWAGYLRPIKPADTVQGNAVFDCPAGNYKVRITDESEQATALVEIPLTFGAETPEIPSPEIPQKDPKK